MNLFHKVASVASHNCSVGAWYAYCLLVL